MQDVYICDGVRTPIGRYGGALSSIRADDLGAVPIRALIERNPMADWARVDDVLYGCANQAGEDNRNVARMSLLLAGLPIDISGATINRLCGSGMDAIGTAARAIKSGEASFVIAGGVESMSRAPFVMPKGQKPFDRQVEIFDTTIGWRFMNPEMERRYGVESMPKTAENIAIAYSIDREDQDRMAASSHERALAAHATGFFDTELIPVLVPQKRGDATAFVQDEHPRKTSIEVLRQLKPIVRATGSVTAGNSSGVNDGACAILLASARSVKEHSLVPRARILAMRTAGVIPSLMGMGPAPASRRVLAATGLSLNQIGVFELNEAFAAQALAVMRDLDLLDDDPRVNRAGGAIALGHPLGASGARLVLTAVNHLHRTNERYALCAMCIGVGQGIAVVLEKV